MASTVSPLLVFLLTGQSNALGTTCLEGDDWRPDTASGAARIWWSNVDAASVNYPPVLYGDSDGEFRPLQPQQGKGEDPAFWGPEFGFVEALPASERGRVRIIKVTLTEGLSALLVCQAVLESWCESRWVRPKAPAEASPPQVVR